MLYYLIKEVSLGNDGSISMENLKNCINNDLANNYGNLCQRVFSFIKKNCSNKIQDPKILTKEDNKLLNAIKTINKNSITSTTHSNLKLNHINLSSDI